MTVTAYLLASTTFVAVDEDILVLLLDGLVEVGLAVELSVGRHVDCVCWSGLNGRVWRGWSRGNIKRW